jgi:eukaryotic-like serine/threonine-protein kinase
MDRSERPASSQSDGPQSSGSDVVPKSGPIEPATGRSAHETGRFRVVTLHASGGMGNVFVAKDDQLNRSVALKEIQDRFADDQQIRDRFLREAEVTGQLEHPGIVPVYALGHYADGRPYYVMRMIRGDSLKQAIAALHRNRGSGDEHAHRLELRRLVNRFVTACNTIEYAHSRGVVHRDIKPDNILLGPYGETLVVDWGLAKLVQSSDVQIDVRAGGDRMFQSPIEATQAGTITGTPAYMSPEQALGWQDAIKPASDIYSLGATLYTLLTGRPPITGDDLGELLVRIQKQDFPRPREVYPSIPRPLEAICLKAMARSMNARHRTAAALAADIEAFLADEPVAAWKEPVSVRAARWVRRHRTLVSTGGATAAVLLMALVIIVFLQGSANRRLTAANNREKSARKDAEAERDKAQQNFQMAQDAVDRYFTQVSEDRRLAAHGLEPLRRDLLKSAGQFYERFVAEDAHKTALNYDSAWAKFRMASITEEIAAPAEAARNFEGAAQTFRDLAKAQGGSSPRSLEGVLMCQINLANLYERMGQRQKGQQALADALEIARTLVKEYPQFAPARHHLARCLGAHGNFALEQGNLAAAATAYQDEIRVREQIVLSQPRQQTFQIELAGAYRNLAVVEQQYEHLDDARKLLEKSLAIDRRLVHENPDDGFLQNMLARTLTLAGDLAACAGRGDEARHAFREAVDLRIALVQRHPDVLEYREALATTTDNFGVFCSDRGEFDAAQTYYQQALVQAERLATDYPKQPEYQTSFAMVLVNAAMLCAARERLVPAEQLLTRAHQILTKLQHDAPNDPKCDEELASVSLALAVVETDAKRGNQAEKHLRSAIEVFQRFSGAHPERPFYGQRLGACLKQLADLFKSENRNDEAVAAYQNAQQLQRRLIAAHPTVLQHRLDLASTCINLGNLRNRLAQSSLAVAAFEETIQLFPAASRSTLDSGARSLLDKAYTGRGLARKSQGDLSGMSGDFEQAITFASPDRARILRLKCANALFGAGQIDRAVAAAEPLATDAGLSGHSAFDLAVLYMRAADAAQAQTSIPAKDRAALVDRRVELGLKLLQRAFAAGYFAVPSNRNKLRTPPFVPLLSTNAAYRKLLEAADKGPSLKDPSPAK